MAREFMDYIKGKLETPFGIMDFALTQGDHVSISAGGSSNEAPSIVVNRVPYYTHLHLFLQSDGSWIRREDSSDPYMSRSIGNDASRAAKEKAYAGIRQAWEAFIAGDEVSLLEAERGHLNNEIRSVDEDIQKAERVVQDLDSKRDSFLAREREVYERLKEIKKKGGYPAPRDWSPRGDVPE